MTMRPGHHRNYTTLTDVTYNLAHSFAAQWSQG